MEGTRYISGLLEQHDCVIIPGLGGFVGSYHPATLHPRYHTFQPPYKKLLFNINLQHNDGLLADFIAREEGIPFADANEKVRSYADSCHQKLRTGKQVFIRDVGRIWMGPEGTIQFDQDLRHNLLAGSFGLHPFFSVPVDKELSKENHPAEPVPEVPVRSLARRAVWQPLKWAALLALPVGIAILMSMTGYDRIRTRGLTYADVFSALTEKLTMPVRAGIESAIVKAPAPVKTEPRALPVLKADDGPVPPVPEVCHGITLDGKFAVIVGAFRVHENADKMILRLLQEQIPAAEYDVTPGGLHRITAGTCATRQEAVALLSKIRSKGYTEAWVLVK